MSLKEVNSAVERRLSPLANLLSTIGLGFIIIMVLLTTVDVIGRRFFNHSLYGAHELQQFSLMIVAFFTLATCQMARQNITIDFIAEKLPRRVMAWIDTILISVAFAGYSLLLWRLLVQAMYLKARGVQTIELLLPEWPFLAIAGGIGMLLFVVTLALTVSQALVEATSK